MSGAPTICATVWVVPEGYLPTSSTGPEPEKTSHGTRSILNAGDAPAPIEITVYFADPEPAGPNRLSAPARRTVHARLNDLDDPEPIPRPTSPRSGAPVVVQHTRLDSRRPANALHDHHRLPGRCRLPHRAETKQWPTP